jgi:hypothetical protein
MNKDNVDKYPERMLLGAEIRPQAYAPWRLDLAVYFGDRKTGSDMGGYGVVLNVGGSLDGAIEQLEDLAISLRKMAQVQGMAAMKTTLPAAEFSAFMNDPRRIARMHRLILKLIDAQHQWWIDLLKPGKFSQS